MIKLVTNEDWNWERGDEGRRSQLVNFYSRGFEFDHDVKVASELSLKLSEIEPGSNEVLIHTLAVGDTEKYGINRNGDGFRRDENKKAHHRFVKNGHVFANHQNKDPAKAIGRVVLSSHNDDMDRIELVFGLDKDKGAKYIEKAAKGEDLSGSMGCRVAFDTCLVCGHDAPNPSSYCDHAKYAMGKILDDGQVVGVDNPDPHYFDWSMVGRPADRIAHAFMLKSASFDRVEQMTSVDLAQACGLYLPVSMMVEQHGKRAADKLSLLGKLSEMEKEIEMSAAPVDQPLSQAAEGEGDITDEEAGKLRKAGLDKVFKALSDAKVVLPFKQFIKLVSSEEADADQLADDVAPALPGIFSRMLDDPEEPCANKFFDGLGGPLPLGAQMLVDKLVPMFGMGEEPLNNRVMVAVIKRKPKIARDLSRKPTPAAENLAKLYATYKLAVLSHNIGYDDPVLTRAALLQHYA